MKVAFYILFLFVLTTNSIRAQYDYFTNQYSKKDSLRGSLRPERTCYDVTHYNLTVDFDLENKYIKGSNIISFELKMPSKYLQIDLFENMKINKISLGEKPLDFFREFDAVFIDISALIPGKHFQIEVYYEGAPLVASNPPWEGGFQWTTDAKGNPWVTVSCQGLGASLWWPNKDHLSDEPDSMNMNFIVPSGLKAISNGNLAYESDNGKKTMFSWEVQYPINNYNVTFSIGKYAHFSEKYHSPASGDLMCDYYVLEYNLEKAKQHFTQVADVLEAFEYYLGPYPFWEDGYAIIETPHLGMEHQSGIAYGNQYKNGYLGQRIPENMNWDYIIVHETGHEYWGNAVSIADHGELWLNEAFTTYMEALFVEYHFGFSEAIHYLKSQRFHQNNLPLIGPKNVNYNSYPDSDQYFKGSWIIHTLRSVLDNDPLFFNLLKTYYQNNKYKTVTSEDFILLTNQMCGKDLSSFFEQYLLHPEIPILEYQLIPKGNDLKVKYRWQADVKNFKMPVKIGNFNNYITVHPRNGKWKSVLLKQTNKTEFQIAKELFLINTIMIK